MFKLGEDKEIIGGFYGTVQLRRYYYHGPDGSLLKYGEFQNLDSIDPPDATTTTLAPTTIGTVTISGDTSPTEGDTATYSVSNDGDASNLSYAWSITGGTGSSSTDSCQVVWGNDGVGQVSCTITSTDPLVADSPATGSLSITIVAVTTPPPLPTPNAPTNVSIITSDYLIPTSIGNLSIFGNIGPTEGDVESYLALNTGDAGNLTYNWTIVGGTGSSTTDTCEVTWGPDGAGSVSCTITSGDDAPTDSPTSSSISVTINAIPTTQPPTTTPAPGGGITPINDNQVRFYVPASANSFTVMGMSSTSFFAVSDGTNTSATAGSSYYSGTGYSYMYQNSPATLSTLVAGDRVIRLYPTDAAGNYDPNGIVYGFSLMNNTEPVTGLDLSYCTGLKYAGMSSVNGSARKQFGASVSSLAPATITEVRAVNISLGADPQSYYSATYNPQYYNGWYWQGGGADLSGQQMSGAALDQFYTDLISDAGDPTLGTLIVSNNPGVSSDDPTIATGKGYTVSG